MKTHSFALSVTCFCGVREVSFLNFRKNRTFLIIKNKKMTLFRAFSNRLTHLSIYG